MEARQVAYRLCLDKLDNRTADQNSNPLFYLQAVSLFSYSEAAKNTKSRKYVCCPRKPERRVKPLF